MNNSNIELIKVAQSIIEAKSCLNPYIGCHKCPASSLNSGSDCPSKKPLDGETSLPIEWLKKYVKEYGSEATTMKQRVKKTISPNDREPILPMDDAMLRISLLV